MSLCINTTEGQRSGILSYLAKEGHKKQANRCGLKTELWGTPQEMSTGKYIGEHLTEILLNVQGNQTYTFTLNILLCSLSTLKHPSACGISSYC